jgi:hypothetical protein
MASCKIGIGMAAGRAWLAGQQQHGSMAHGAWQQAQRVTGARYLTVVHGLMIVCGLSCGSRLTSTSPLERFERELRHELLLSGASPEGGVSGPTGSRSFGATAGAAASGGLIPSGGSAWAPRPLSSSSLSTSVAGSADTGASELDACWWRRQPSRGGFGPRAEAQLLLQGGAGGSSSSSSAASLEPFSKFCRLKQHSFGGAGRSLWHVQHRARGRDDSPSPTAADRRRRHRYSPHRQTLSPPLRTRGGGSHGMAPTGWGYAARTRGGGSHGMARIPTRARTGLTWAPLSTTLPRKLRTSSLTSAPTTLGAHPAARNSTRG